MSYNARRRDIYVVRCDQHTEQSNVYLPQKRDTISNFYQESSSDVVNDEQRHVC